MRKAIFIIALSVLAAACKNKDLYYGDERGRQAVNVVIDWPAGAVKPSNSMRVNLFSRNTQPDYGRVDMGSDGGNINLPLGADYMGLCYNYHDNQIIFADQDNAQQIRVYCAQITRSTYSRAYPDETTHIQPDADLYTAKVASFPVHASADPLVMLYEVENIIKTYTFEVENVKGTELITDVRGAISGMTNGYFLSSQTYFQEPATIFFSATADVANNRITGSFRTFGRLDMDNFFTLEILFPSNDGRILQYTYNVTPQIDTNNHFHIHIADSGIDVPDESGQSSEGWGVDVNDWDRVPVQL